MAREARRNLAYILKKKDFPRGEITFPDVKPATVHVVRVLFYPDNALYLPGLQFHHMPEKKEQGVERLVPRRGGHIFVTARNVKKGL